MLSTARPSDRVGNTIGEQKLPSHRLITVESLFHQTLLIVSLRGFQDFENHKQVISYLGLSPRIFESGTSVKGKAKICKMGMGEVRSCLYMAARAAKRHNPACKALYDRLRAKGKVHKQAMIAVVNKLLKQAFAIVKSGQRFDPSYPLAAA